MNMTYWLIEVGSPPQFYCGPGDWCSNAHHAQKFMAAALAQAVADDIYARAGGPLVGGYPRVVAHAWD